MEIFFLLKIALKNGWKCELIEESLLRNKLHTCDLKSAQLPNVTKNNIQISKTLPIIMGSIAKMKFERNFLKKSKLKN